jgi:hypothetical protein
VPVRFINAICAHDIAELPLKLAFLINVDFSGLKVIELQLVIAVKRVVEGDVD